MLFSSLLWFESSSVILNSIAQSLWVFMKLCKIPGNWIKYFTVFLSLILDSTFSLTQRFLNSFMMYENEYMSWLFLNSLNWSESAVTLRMNLSFLLLSFILVTLKLSRTPLTTSSLLISSLKVSTRDSETSSSSISLATGMKLLNKSDSLGMAFFGSSQNTEITVLLLSFDEAKVEMLIHSFLSKLSHSIMSLTLTSTPTRTSNTCLLSYFFCSS
mmetsp:Transcript_11516/g.13092  ORF Transcript_11516/g.13092 Transcript_11516/m.13092 type:complete len:215 (+) Transcript_11516:47-691(+)